MSKKIIFLFLSTCFLTACTGPSASKYAQKFCACSEALSKAESKITTGKIDQQGFEAIVAEHRLCIGTDDPLEQLKDQPKKLDQFKKEFLTELEKQCPVISRDMGF